MEEFNYAKDKASVFVNNTKINVADVASFKVLTLGYVMDNSPVFYKSAFVNGAIVANFKTHPHTYTDEDAADAANKYLEGKKVRLE